MTAPPSDPDPANDDAAAEDGAALLDAFTFDVRTLSDLVSDHAVVLLDVDGCVAAWNDSARALAGYDADEIVGSHYRRLFPASVRDTGRPERILERARVEGRAEDEGWRVRGDGSRFWARDVVASIREAADGSKSIGDADARSHAGDAATDSNVERQADSNVEFRGYLLFVHDRTDEYERKRELREEKAVTESLFEAQPDLLYAYDTEGNLIHWNDRHEEITGYDPDELAGMGPLEFIAPPDRERIADAIERILEHGERITAEGRLLTKDGRWIPYEFNSARITDDDDGTVLGFTGVGRDISDRRARERELERLERLNAIVRTVDERMVTAETRAQIERAVVDEFATADPYRFAVLGRMDAPTSDRRSWEPTAWAGIDPDAAEGDVVASFVEPPEDAPGQSPLETGTVQRYRNVPESRVDAWSRDARERGYGSVAVVPIVAGDRSFGILVVAATEPAAFADREREVLQEFGGTVGHAINAMAVRRLLYRDTAVELELESTDRRDTCIDLSHRAECRLSIDHLLPLTDDVFVYYLTVTDVDPDRIRDVSTAHSAVREVRRIAGDADNSQWELTVHGSTFADVLTEYGARLRSKTIDSGLATIVVEASPDTPIRELIDTLQSAYPETTLLSKRTVERSIETPGDFRNRVEASLTDKQQTALEAAYYGGYFEWPTRTSNAGDIAERLGVARQTFHQHLRVAERKLLTAYFEPNE